MEPDRVVWIGRRAYPLPAELPTAAEVRVEGLWRAAVAGSTTTPDHLVVEVIQHTLGVRAALAAAIRGRREVHRVTHQILANYGHTQPQGDLPWA